MGRGTQVVLGLSMVTNLWLGTFAYSYSTQVPKLEQKVQVLEHTVSQQRETNDKLQGENNNLKKEISQSEKEIQELNQELSDKKKQLAKSSRSSSSVVRKLNGFQVTWYNDSGITKSGRHTKDNVTIAVDPNIIPLGTWVKLTFPDGREMIRRADDTGGAVNGRIIDVYDNASTSTLLDRGRTHGVAVQILNRK